MFKSIYNDENVEDTPTVAAVPEETVLTNNDGDVLTNSDAVPDILVIYI